MTGSGLISAEQDRMVRAREQKNVFLFNGQGSQYYHMAHSLYQNHELFRETLEYFDRIVKEYIGRSMLSVMYDTQRDKGESFSDLRFTHPAIFCVQYSLASLFKRSGWIPDYVLGMSLGEFVAAAIAGAIEPEAALEAVLKQALAIERCCAPGAMMAVMSSVDFFSDHPEIFEGSVLAGVNYDEHFVIASDIGAQKRIQAALQKRGVIHLALPVCYGFHSALIDPAERTCQDYLAGLQFNEPVVSVVSCQTGAELTSYDRMHFWRVVREPMRFSAALQWFESQVSDGRGVNYVDLSPGGTLANFIQRSIDTESASSFQSIITPFDQEAARLREVERSL